MDASSLRTPRPTPLKRAGLRRAWRAAGIAALVGVAALALAACSDDTDEASATAAATEAATESATMAATEAAGSATTPATASAADGAPLIGVATDGPLAPYLIGPDGRTLYIFTNDAPGVSNCATSCLANWPALLVAAGEEPTADGSLGGELGVIERSDGAGRHVTYDGQPLYYWIGDTAPGMTNGHEVGGVWFVAPAGETSGSAGAASGGSSSGGAGY